MANKRSDKYDHAVVDGFVKWAKEKHGWERGTDYNINPRFNPKTGKVKVILVKALSEEAKETLQKNPKILMKYSGVIDVDVANDGMLFVRFQEKGPGGRKPGSSTRKKRTTHKVGHRKLSKGKSAGKRAPKFRLPRNSSKKPHIVTVINLLNSFTDAQRAECVNVLSKFLPNGSSEKKVTIQFRKRRLLSTKGRKKLLAAVMEILNEKDSK